ncbi:mRNA splicing protein prp28 [Coemansia thaxteri]|uniref:RNA helicase n=1 Tax=Coemansia thaxteri TaxID=2663907 RepID=A0A9W8BKS5_9FUNG|nr:mRNA splicing protein prp28 [Coemansia thaxteri]KAJ2488132.1 mRNA splicing protein prp28 [Coemansia sp. RSA 2320]
MERSIRHRTEPLSIEEALRLKNQQAEPTRPVFLTKAQRAQLALEHKQQEADDMRQRRTEQVKILEKTHKVGENGEHISEDFGRRLHMRETDKRRSRSPPARGRSRYHDRDELRSRRDDGRIIDRYRPTARSRSPSKTTGAAAAAAGRGGEFTHVGRQSTDGSGDRVLTDKEREAIRQRYLVGDAVERKRKQSSRKVQFDWDAAEDTSRDISDLYEHRQALSIFGKQNGGSEKAHCKAQSDERHWTEKALGEMRDRDWRIFKEDYSIACKGGSIPHPYRSWEESEIPGEILHAIADIGYQAPTPIQRQAIPLGLQRRDLIGIAETGSGKTASFLIPMLAFIMAQPPLSDRNMADGPYALVLAPTRELAQQIEAESHKFARRLGFRCVSIVGGHDIERQAFALRNGSEIVIATPGRLRDCIERRVLVLNQCTYVVMDEADRMIDMGFEEDVNYILDALPVSNVKHDAKAFRQTTMFSATMPSAVERLARKYLRAPATVTIGTAGKAVDSVEQRAEFIVGEEKRKRRLLDLLNSHAGTGPIIVFVNQKKNVDLLGHALARTRYAVVTLHGGKTQEQREQALARLKSGAAEILVATDVAGRGIDVKDVVLVVNFDMAKDIESYTHRIGRTGRAGKRGLAVTFLSPVDDRDVLYDLRKMIAASPLSRCPPELATHEAAQAPPSLLKSAARSQHQQR